MAYEGSNTQVDRRAAATADGSLAINGGKPVRLTWLPYGRQNISEADIEAVNSVLRSDWLTQGPNIGLFEEEFAKVVGAKYAVAFGNGTAALHAAYFAAGIGSGDEIVTTAMTFAATANAALYLGATPKFADISLDTGNIDPQSVCKLITSKTKAIVSVDYAGQSCDVDELAALAKEKNLVFITDAAHSLGSLYKERPVGALADLTTFSFHPVKTITTGEGGMVTTNNSDYAHKLKVFRTHGIEKDPKSMHESHGAWYHEMQALGFNYRLTDFQAALGLSQLGRLKEFVDRRRQIAEKYHKAISKMKTFKCLEEKSECKSAYHLFPVLVQQEPYDINREKIFAALHAENIGVQVHYIPTYRHPYYRQLFGDDAIKQCPNTELFYSQEISLPIFPSMTDADSDDVLAALQKIDDAVVRN